MIFMSRKKKKGNDNEIFTLYPTDGSFPEISSKITIKKSRRKKKHDVKAELDNARMDMIQ